MNYYSLTLQKTELPIFISDYEAFLTKLKADYPNMTIHSHYELGSTNGYLHIHALIQSPTRMYINKVHPGKGYKLDFQFTRHRAAWSAYINKDSLEEQALIMEQEQDEYEFRSSHSTHELPNPTDLDIERAVHKLLMKRLKTQRIV